jgi:hypothetical protein
MRFLGTIEAIVFDGPRARFLALLFAAMLVKTGVWRIPNLDVSAAIARNPFVVPIPNPIDQYLMTSWLGPFLAWLVGASSVPAFFVLHLALSVAFTALMAAMIFSRLEENEARAAMVIFAALPVSATSYFWVGNDSLTLLLMAGILALRERPFAAGLLGVALGMQHFEQGLFAFGALALAARLGPRYSGREVYPLRTALAAGVGIATGKIVLTLIFMTAGMTVSGRTVWLMAHLPALMEDLLYRGHVLIWSILGVGWLVALRFADGGRASIPFFLCLLALMPLLLVSGDKSRVLAMTTFPLVAAFWLMNRDFLRGLMRREIAILALVWLIVPWSWVWRGIPLWSVMPYDIALAASHLLGWPVAPADGLADWPFKGR